MELRARTSQKRRGSGSRSDDDASYVSVESSEEELVDESLPMESGDSSSRSSDWANTDDSESINVTLAVPDKHHFTSWDSFHSYLDRYFAASYQVFRVRTNTTVERRNTDIRNKNSKAPEIPSEWEYYAKTLVCTCFGKYKSKGKSKRPRQETRLSDCKAQINACVRLVDKAKHKFAVCITKCNPVHNHVVNRQTFYRFSSIHKVLDDDVVESVDMLRKAGAKHKNIMKFIIESTDANPSIQDVRNMVRSLKQSENVRGSRNSAKRLKTWMQEFCEAPGNIGRIFVETMQTKV
ncbi:hypothetical protein DVH05_015142 [Phytophthora capsici]|nr:hypothetical protein DVH05_015142 [Phytophthora capsici]